MLRKGTLRGEPCEQCLIKKRIQNPSVPFPLLLNDFQTLPALCQINTCCSCVSSDYIPLGRFQTPQHPLAQQRVVSSQIHACISGGAQLLGACAEVLGRR